VLLVKEVIEEDEILVVIMVPVVDKQLVKEEEVFLVVNMANSRFSTNLAPIMRASFA
jgi:hypothetical protein